MKGMATSMQRTADASTATFHDTLMADQANSLSTQQPSRLFTQQTGLPLAQPQPVSVFTQQVDYASALAQPVIDRHAQQAVPPSMSRTVATTAQHSTDVLFSQQSAATFEQRAVDSTALATVDSLPGLGVAREEQQALPWTSFAPLMTHTVAGTAQQSTGGLFSQQSAATFAQRAVDSFALATVDSLPGLGVAREEQQALPSTSLAPVAELYAASLSNNPDENVQVPTQVDSFPKLPNSTCTRLPTSTGCRQTTSTTTELIGCLLN
jgi:tRNA pseudouridine-54 N-methylase